MNEQNVKERVYKTLAETIGLDAKDMRDDQHLVNDLGADSLDVIEAAMALEEEFNIEVPDDDVYSGKWQTIGQICDYVADRARVARQ